VLCYRTNGGGERGVARFVKALIGAGIDFTELEVKESSLEDIFVDLVGHNGRSRGQ
jgi:ABC-2 type transport system ATP-binding protein